MNERIRDFARESHLDVYGLGKYRDQWESTVEKFAELIVAECASVVENQGRFLTYTALTKEIKKKFGVKE